MFGLKSSSLFGDTKKLEREIDEFVDILSEVGLVFKSIVPIYLNHSANEKFEEMVDRVKEMDLEIIRGPVVHSPYDPRGDGSWGENESFYVFDPDGHRLEIFCDMASIDDDGTFRSFKGQRIEEAKVIEI